MTPFYGGILLDLCKSQIKPAVESDPSQLIAPGAQQPVRVPDGACVNLTIDMQPMTRIFANLLFVCVCFKITSIKLNYRFVTVILQIELLAKSHQSESIL